MLKYKKSTFYFIFIFWLILVASPVLAGPNLKNAFETGETSILGRAAGQAGYVTEGAENQIQRVVGQVIYLALSLLGVIFVCLMVYGGYLWMTDRGNEDQVRTAKKLITAAVFGLFIVIGAYLITFFILENIAEPFLNDAPAQAPN